MGVQDTYIMEPVWKDMRTYSALPIFNQGLNIAEKENMFCTLQGETIGPQWRRQLREHQYPTTFEKKYLDFFYSLGANKNYWKKRRKRNEESMGLDSGEVRLYCDQIFS